MPVVVAAAALVTITAGCGETPTGPSSAASLSLVRLEITGPESVEPGGTAQLGARGTLSDGTTRDLSHQVVWSVTPTQRISMSRSGLVTAGSQLGEAQVTAAYAGTPKAAPGADRATRDQFVLPPGTYRLARTIRNAGAPLDGAFVVATSGARNEVATTTAAGSFIVYGMSGDVTVEITKGGFLTEVIHVPVSSNSAKTIDLNLKPFLDGVYTMTISAAAECRDNLPERARQRRYGIAIRQNGVDVAATLGTRSFTGTAGPGRVVLSLPSNLAARVQFTPPVIFEDFEATDDLITMLAIHGEATASPSANGLAGRLDGSIELWTLPWFLWYDAPWDWGRAGSCRSSAHQFMLTRGASPHAEVRRRD
jgi:hypothetical protein